MSFGFIWVYLGLFWFPKSGWCELTKAKRKTSEILVDRRIFEASLTLRLACPNQHVYTESKPVETTLYHRAKYKIRPRQKALYLSGFSRYKEGLQLPVKRRLHGVHDLESVLVRWTNRLLRDRKIPSECASGVRQGTPQKGVLTVNLIINGIPDRTEKEAKYLD